ncbi:hypothetical protein pipiens_015424 [Culex pipiens pipiens]|uniref:Uncharacterized protein n=1 Tax=Culex pipiens pipiens TaxID=38569 RepID=A0ABD1CQH5_CULPP
MTDRLKQRLDLISNGSSTPNAADPEAVRNQLGEREQDYATLAKEPELKKDAPETSKESVASSVKEESSLKSSEVDSCTEETNLYASNARKFNGISSTSGSELDDKSAVQTPANVTTTAASTTTTTTAANKLDLTQALTSEDALYEVSVWFDGTELQFLSVEKVIENKLAAPGLAESTQYLTGIDSSKQSSNGSVGSLGPFQLPSARPAADSHSSATDSSGTISSQSKAPLFKVKHTVRGAKLMIEEFTKIKRALSKDDELSDAELDQSIEASLLEERQEAETGHTRICRAGTASEPGRLVVLYGAVVRPKVQCRQGHKGDNKFMMLFEDGASKALSKDVIVIGDKDTLPIVGHAVHAFTGGDTYEVGFVDEVKRNETINEVLYVVRIGKGTVEVTASGLYLNEEQAK